MLCLPRWIAPVLLFFAVALAPARTGSASEPVDYTHQVKPLLKARCLACHGALKQKAALRVDTGEAIRRGGDSGPAAEPGKPDESPLIERIVETDVTLRMPPQGEGSQLTTDEVEVLRSWVAQGAASPADEKPEPDPRKHWSFSPPVRPAAPAVRDASQPVRNPIDAFLASARDFDPLRRGYLAQQLAHEASRYVAPLPAVEPELFLAGVTVARRDREARALQLEAERLGRLAPVLRG